MSSTVNFIKVIPLSVLEPKPLIIQYKKTHSKELQTNCSLCHSILIQKYQLRVKSKLFQIQCFMQEKSPKQLGFFYFVNTNILLFRSQSLNMKDQITKLLFKGFKFQLNQSRSFNKKAHGMKPQFPQHKVKCKYTAFWLTEFQTKRQTNCK